MRFEGVKASREQAEALLGVELAHRAGAARRRRRMTKNFEDYADLIGLRAEDEAGRAIGTVRAIHNTRRVAM